MKIDNVMMRQDISTYEAKVAEKFDVIDKSAAMEKASVKALAGY